MPASKNNGRPTTKPWATWLYASSPRRSGIRPCARSPQPFAKAANRGEIVGCVGTAVSDVPAPYLFSSSCILPSRLYLSITRKCPAWQRPFPQSQGGPHLRGTGGANLIISPEA